MKSSSGSDKKECSYVKKEIMKWQRIRELKWKTKYLRKKKLENGK